MKKFRFIATCSALLITAGLSAQKTAPVNPDSTTKKEEKVEVVSKNDTKQSAVQKAKAYSTMMCEALGIKDDQKKKMISTINDNYEIALEKSTTDKMSATEVESLKEKLDNAREGRLKGVLSAAELKSYTIWKQKMKADSSK